MSEVPVRDAATVVLLRDGDVGLQTWLLTRVEQMVFAAGMSVFPGGRVDEADVLLPFAAGAGSQVAARFGCGESTALALLGAAVRETFEETGVLLTEPMIDLSSVRADVEEGRVSFGDLLRANGLTIAADVLRPWARWVTPAGEARRYDTRFFVGALPAGAQAQDLTSESSEASWVGVGESLEQARRGKRGMLPPTIMTLAALESFGTVAAALAAAPTGPIDAVRPHIRAEGDKIIAELPDGTRVELPKSMFVNGLS
ncbi:MAG: NUDIX domain-containing protein [Jatrophihabitantaceae bacterium]